MRTLTYQLRDLKKVTIEIGFEGENNRTQVRIDCGEVFAEYPNAEAAMKVQAPKGGIYPGTVTRDGNMILWTVRDCDVANNGNGEFQLTFTDGETVVKSCKGKTHIDKSLKGSGTAPSGVQDWLDNAEEVLEGVEAAEIHQPMIGLDGYWYKWDQTAKEYVSTGTKAQGQDGVGIASIVKTGTVGLVDTYTITFTNGTTTTYTVTNGEGGTVIDDTTPASDKVFSSEKVNTELNTVKSALQAMQPNATASDIGKALLVKTVENGKPASWEYGEAGGAEIDDTAGAGATNKVWSANKTISEIQQIIVSGGVPIDDTAGQGDIDKIWSASKCYEMKSSFDLFTTEVPSKNLYDKNSCNPQDGYIYQSTYGNLSESPSYAVTGKIPVDEGTQYIFSTGGNAKVKKVSYFSGSDGGTFMSQETLDNAAFTTPTGCTYVGLSLFAQSHTTEQFNAAIAAGQLERGNTATSYEPYGSVGYVFSLPAETTDEGKPLTPKRVSDGKVVEWEYADIEVEVDDTLTQSGVSADAKVVGDAFGEISELVHSKNLYNPTDCSPQDGKQYKTDGTVQDAENYAITGKIPCEASTQYIFSIGGLGKVKSAYFYKGDSGETFISKETLDNAAFTTPALTTYVALTLFAASHTTQEYNAAIAVAQLEKGSVATSYVPYSIARKIPTKSLEDGDSFEGVVNYTTFKTLINIYDKSIAEDGKYVNNSSHAVLENDAYSYSGFIPVEPNKQYCYSKDLSVSAGSLSSTYYEWDANKEFIRSGSVGTSTTHINQVHTGATTRYITFNITYSGSHTSEQFNALIDTLMVVEGCQRPLEYSAYNVEPVVNHQKFDDMYSNNADRFRGKKWLAFGTSVTYQDSKVYTEGVADGELVRGYVGDIARRKPMIVFNEGVSGSTLAGSDANSLINRYQSFTYTDYDFVTLEYGINDFGNNVPVGSASDAAGTGSFAACLKTIIEYILTANPIIGLIICTDPHVRDSTNNNGNTLKEYADVTLEIAKQYSLPVCNWFYYSGINSITKGNGTSRHFLTQAGTHPSVYGHMRMGAMLNQVFDSLLC